MKTFAYILAAGAALFLIALIGLLIYTQDQLRDVKNKAQTMAANLVRHPKKETAEPPAAAPVENHQEQQSKEVQQ